MNRTAADQNWQRHLMSRTQMNDTPHPPQRYQPRHPRYDAIHRALLTGLISHVGTKTETHEYAGPRGVRFSIFPGSALFGQKQKWLMAAELVETTKLYGRTCAPVQPQWIERAAAHLVERSYSDPRWDSKTASVLATEKVSLHGLALIPARVVPYSPINPRQAREMFIHHALVLQDYRTQAAFFRHNAKLVEEVQLLEAKIRQRNLLADAATRFTFYDARLPLDVTHGTQFEAWRRREERENPRLLFMDKADLLRADAPEISPENYPDRLADRGGHFQLPLTYRYEPGETNDGLTLSVPVAALAQLRPERYEWLVPGMLEEKIAAMLRELPGHLRRNFVPVPTWAEAATAALLASPDRDADISLREALATYLAHQTGTEITAADFNPAALPDFMRMAFRVIDDEGHVLGISRDLPQLQRKLAAQTAGSFASIHHKDFSRPHVTHWDFGDLTESLTVQRFGMTITAYPALVEEADACALRLLPAKHLAHAAHRAGTRRLFRSAHRRDVKTLARRLPNFDKMALQHLTLGETAALREDLITLVLDRALFSDRAVPRTQADYQDAAQIAAARLDETGRAVSELVATILRHYHELTLAMEDASRAAIALADVREQLAHLMPAKFLLATPWEWLEQFPRYLAAMRLRLEKIHAGASAIEDRDMNAMTLIAPWWNRYLERKTQHDALGTADTELALFRWMIEEYRVHLFAQELGTLVPVSPRRLEKQWEKTLPA